MTRTSLFTRSALVAAAAGALTLVFAGPASAHVTVNPNSATQGGFTKVSFRVPNETDNTDTTKVEVNLPTDAPIAFVSLKPVAGWAAATETTKLATPIKREGTEITEAVSKITWTAQAGAAIKPHQFQEFDVSLGPLPETKQVVFKALQTYSDGVVVRWIDEPTTDGSEPEHPAPVLKLAAAGAASTPAAGAGTTATASDTGTAASDANNQLSLLGLGLGVVALVLALLAYRRAGQRTADDSVSADREKVAAGK
jgi:uncharacterized protein YcnI